MPKINIWLDHGNTPATMIDPADLKDPGDGWFEFRQGSTVFQIHRETMQQLLERDQ